MTESARALSSSVRRLWLVRHGESTWNASELVQGQATGPTLSATGLRQVQRCAEVLAGEPVRAVYSSDLRRAAETAAPIARALGLEVAYDERLRERALGDAEGRRTSLLGPDRSGISVERVVDADVAPAGGETIRELYERASTCAAELLARGDGDVVFVCHGGTVRVLLAWLDDIGPDDMAWPEVHNAQLVERSVAVPAPAG